MDGSGNGEASGSGTLACGGVGVAVGCTRRCAIKVMKFPLGDQATASGKTHDRSGGIMLRRNFPSDEYMSMRNRAVDSSSVPYRANTRSPSGDLTVRINANNSS